MAKRFIDTEIWKKKWFRELPPKLKNTWFFLFTNCDHAGIYEVDLDLMNFQHGQKVTEEEIRSHLGDQIAVISEDKWYLTKFVKYQYGDLNPNVKAHQSVLKLLEKYNIDSKGLLNSYEPVQDKDTDIDKLKKKHKLKKDVGLKSITKQMLADLQLIHKRVNVASEFEKFKDYLASKGKHYKDYHAGFRNWLKSEFVAVDTSAYETLARKIKMNEQSVERAKIEKQIKDEEIGGPPPEFIKEIQKLTRKTNVTVKE